MSSVGKLPNLFIVADGMGGHKAGDVASRKSIEEFIKYVCTTNMTDPANILDSGGLPGPAGRRQGGPAAHGGRRPGAGGLLPGGSG